MRSPSGKTFDVMGITRNTTHGRSSIPSGLVLVYYAPDLSPLTVFENGQTLLGLASAVAEPTDSVIVIQHTHAIGPRWLHVARTRLSIYHRAGDTTWTLR
ncbi:MAG TPA: hypothetical protein VGM82_03505 [Gemmatimonadaceae bacterium]